MHVLEDCNKSLFFIFHKIIQKPVYILVVHLKNDCYSSLCLRWDFLVFGLGTTVTITSTLIGDFRFNCSSRIASPWPDCAKGREEFFSSFIVSCSDGVGEIACVIRWTSNEGVFVIIWFVGCIWGESDSFFTIVSWFGSLTLLCPEYNQKPRVKI